MALIATVPPLVFGAVKPLAALALVVLLLVGVGTAIRASTPLRRACVHRPARVFPRVRSVLTLASDLLMLMGATGLLIGLLVTPGPSTLPAAGDFIAAAAFLFLGLLHHCAHRR
ncbi:hypothetical protein [Streptomyces nanshensis]|nr:hypothetical protein [Streptomyces nanshensis]